MKKHVWLIVMAILSCNNREQTQDTIIVPLREESDWTYYEGRVPVAENKFLYIELSLRAANESGEGEFKLREFVEDENTRENISSFDGGYTTLYGQPPDEKVVHFHRTALADGLKRVYLSPASKGDDRVVIREEPFRTRDLAVRINGKNKLIVLDNQMRAVTGEAEHNLVRRMARPFTIEGYFRHNGYSANFFEINTGENWEVSKYGEYHKAIRHYYELTEKKFEVTYLKAIGFPIHQPGSEEEALVIKRVLQMTPAAINDQ